MNKRLTFSVFMIQREKKKKTKQKKQNKFNRAFDQYEDYFFDLKLKI